MFIVLLFSCTNDEGNLSKSDDINNFDFAVNQHVKAEDDPCFDCCLSYDNWCSVCPECNCTIDDCETEDEETICGKLFREDGVRKDNSMISHLYEIRSGLLKSGTPNEVQLVVKYYQNRNELLRIINESRSNRDFFYSMMQDVKSLKTSLLNNNESVVITQDFVDKVKFLENLIRMNTKKNDKIVEDMDFVLQELDLDNHIGQSPKDVWQSLKN